MTIVSFIPKQDTAGALTQDPMVMSLGKPVLFSLFHVNYQIILH